MWFHGLVFGTNHRGPFLRVEKPNWVLWTVIWAPERLWKLPNSIETFSRNEKSPTHQLRNMFDVSLSKTGSFVYFLLRVTWSLRWWHTVNHLFHSGQSNWGRLCRHICGQSETCTVVAVIIIIKLIVSNVFTFLSCMNHQLAWQDCLSSSICSWNRPLPRRALIFQAAPSISRLSNTVQLYEEEVHRPIEGR